MKNHISRKKCNIPGMPRSFRESFRGPDLWANARLWQAYQIWQQQNQAQIMAQFREDIMGAREKAGQQVDAIPNPFNNSRKGVFYETSIQLPAWMRRYQFFGLGAVGLAAEEDPHIPGLIHISGVPAEQGEHELILVYIYPGWRRGINVLTRTFKLNVLPDPKDLWQDIPSDQQEEYARPDTEAVSIICPDSMLVAASRRGRSHAHTGKARDDAYSIGCIDGWQVMVVADGAGSAEFSRKGAQLACDTALAECGRKLLQSQELDEIFADAADGREGWLVPARKIAYSILAGAAFEAHKAIRKEAGSRGQEPKTYATTFLLSVSRKYPAGWALMTFQVGDGAMAVFHGDQSELLAEPDEGEYGGQTRFITMPEIFEPQELMRRIRVDFIPDLQELILMTDGVSDSRFVTLEGLRNSILWNELREELDHLLVLENAEDALLEWLNFWSKGNHDDRTVAIMKTGN